MPTSCLHTHMLTSIRKHTYTKQTCTRSTHKKAPCKTVTTLCKTLQQLKSLRVQANAALAVFFPLTSTAPLCSLSPNSTYTLLSPQARPKELQTCGFLSLKRPSPRICMADSRASFMPWLRYHHLNLTHPECPWPSSCINQCSVTWREEPRKQLKRKAGLFLAHHLRVFSFRMLRPSLLVRASWQKAAGELITSPHEAGTGWGVQENIHPKVTPPGTQ